MKAGGEVLKAFEREVRPSKNSYASLADAIVARQNWTSPNWDKIKPYGISFAYSDYSKYRNCRVLYSETEDWLKIKYLTRSNAMDCFIEHCHTTPSDDNEECKQVAEALFQDLKELLDSIPVKK